VLHYVKKFYDTSVAKLVNIYQFKNLVNLQSFANFTSKKSHKFSTYRQNTNLMLKTEV